MTDQPRPTAVTPPAVAAPVQARFFYGWYVVFAAATVTFVEMAGFNTTFSVFVKPMTEEFGWTRTQFSIGVSIGSLLAGVLVLGLGRVIDLRGPKYVILGGVTTLVVCLTLLSQVSALWQLWVLFAISRALSSTTLDLSSTVMVANWFIRLRGRAMGLASLGRRVAIALLPLIGQAIIVAFGWRAGWVGVAVIVALVGILPTALLVRRRPEDMGLRPDGAAPANPAPAESASGLPRALRQDVSWTLQEALRTPAFWLLMGVGCAAFFVGGSVNLHQVVYMIDMGLSPTVAVTSLSLYAVAGAAGTLFWGWLADRLPVRYCFAMDLAWAAIGVSFLHVATSESMAYLYAVVYGIGFGGIIPLTATAWADYFGRKSLGSVRSVAMTAQMVSNAIGPLFAAFVYDSSGSYQWAWIAFACAYVTGMVLVLLSRVPRHPSVA